MKKSSIIILTVSVFVVLVAAVGGWYYYYKYVETVDDYILVLYSPPQEKEGLFGDVEYSKPQVEVKSLQSFDNDSIAIVKVTQDYENKQDFLCEKLKEWESGNPKDEVDKMSKQARYDAIQSLIAQKQFLIRLTHTRSFDENKAMEIISKFWGKEDFDNVIIENKLDVAIFDIN